MVEYKDATTIRIVQQALNDKGYNCGNPDGVAGGNTTTAITQYQTENGITANGLVTDELLQSLGIVEKVQEAVAAEASKMNTAQIIHMTSLQEILMQIKVRK